MAHATRHVVRHAPARKSARLVDSSDSSHVKKPHVSPTRRTGTVRLVRHAPAVESPPDSSTRQTRRLVRLVDSSDSSIFSRMFWVSFGSPGDRIRTAYLLGKFDQSDAARFKCVSGRPGCWFPPPLPPLT